METFPRLQWCCFKSSSASTNWWSACSALSPSFRRWESRSNDDEILRRQKDECCIRFVLHTSLDLFCFPLSSQALAGEVGMSNELDEVARALSNGYIPAIWKKLAPDTLKSLGNWMSHFKRRYEQYSHWVRTHTLSQIILNILCQLLHYSSINVKPMKEQFLLNLRPPGG